MPLPHHDLKDRQRAERDDWPEHLSLRVHRALSWLNRAELCDDEDGRFIFLWIAFNAAYANEMGEYRLTESRLFGQFLERLANLDDRKRLASVIWDQYSGPIRVLLDQKFVFQPYWDHLNGLESGENWRERFGAANRAALHALSGHRTGDVLGVIFGRLYTLRNQLVHGGATWNSYVNRDQLRDANAIMGELVPIVIEIMMDNAHEHWGEACYPVVNDT
ncbi:MAG: HEPN domain-containing protein [Xanthomonadales bacterium]|nr:HEPN domain-containing protein [Xanthomonadales bacterium]